MSDLYFAMSRGPRGLSPALYHGEFQPSADERARIEYACKVPDELAGKSLDELAALYWRLRERGKLPAALSRLSDLARQP